MDMFKDILFNPSHENRDFKCDICNKYLSIAPILFHKSVGKVCGRCFERGETTKYPDVTFEAQTVYEKIAKHIIFPCSFQAKGCKKKLEWDQVSKHEDECDYKENKCPFGQDDALIFEGKKCGWIGENKNLICHLKETHSEYCNDSIKMNLQIPNRTRSKILISDFMDITVVAILFISEAPNVAEESSNIYFHLFMDTVSDDYTYDLEVSDEKGKHKMVFPENRIDPLCERVFTAYGLKYGFNLDIAGLEALLRSDSLNFWFKIKSKQSCLSGEELGVNPKQQTIFENRCVTCPKILIDSIFLCNNGHNNCELCYKKGWCTCGEKIRRDRNWFLENLSKMSLYECENKDQGCSEIVLHKNYEFHKQNCKLTDKKCIIAYEDCKWVGNNVGMLYHLTEDHSANKINLNEDYLFSAKKRTHKFFTVFNGIIFVISIHIDPDTNLSVRVHYFNSETSIYRYEFSITTGKLKLRCSQYCIQWIEETVNLCRSPYIYYPLDFLEEFLEDRSEFHFRVNIFP